SFCALRFLDADMDCHSLDFGHGRRDLDNFAVGDIAVGLQNYLVSACADSVGHGLAGRFRVTMSPSPWPRRSRGSAPGTAGFRRVKKVAVDSGMPTPCRAGGTSTFSPPVICTEKSMNVMS